MPNTEEDLIGAVMVIQEMIERERRQDHIVLVNIPEQVAGNKKDQTDSDAAIYKDLLVSISDFSSSKTSKANKGYTPLASPPSHRSSSLVSPSPRRRGVAPSLGDGKDSSDDGDSQGEKKGCGEKREETNPFRIRIRSDIIFKYDENEEVPLRLPVSAMTILR
ncbi:hypothetical protein QE152_g27752 [Popillia japonica]|uniref:Uncharacterized protein n=1 Tax=Popillia japonica TaxID=7064 RepID=A0AAW1JJL8_POPJA